MIDILLSTYNGSAYIAEQLDSLMAQSFSDFQVLVRDDCSDDTSLDVISEYVRRYPYKIRLIPDENQPRLGATGSFSRLLEYSNAEYIMFCDQDDVWAHDKVEKTYDAMISMQQEFGQDTPLLVHTDLKVVGDDLETITDSFWKHQNLNPQGRESLNRMLVQNVVTGCTVMINRKLKDFASPVPSKTMMYDWWLGLVAAAFGEIKHLPDQTVLYRQHGQNALGAKKWGWRWIVKLSLGNKGEVRRNILRAQNQAAVFVDRYQDRLPEKVLVLSRAYADLNKLNYFMRISTLIKHKLFKAGVIRNIGFFMRA